MNKRESIIRNYFKAWIDVNNTSIQNIFSEDAVYSECYGPEYHGLKQILLWFEEWNKHGKVIKWDIQQFIHASSSTAVEWYFECDYDGEISSFNGVSIIEFTSDYKIKLVKEFQSKAEHIYPYDNK